MRHHGSSMRHPDHLKTTLPGRVRVRSDYRRKMTQYTDVTKLASSSPAGRAPARVREYRTVHLRGPPGSWKLERAVSYTWEHAVQNAHQTAIEDRDTSHYTEYDVVFTIARVVPTGRAAPRGPAVLFLLRSMRPPPSSRVHINQESSMYESKTVRASPWLAASPRRPRPCEAALQPRRRLCQALPALPYVLLASLGGAPCYR
jgi:hypothetical protein